MSEENRPNFNAVQFAMDIVRGLANSVRGDKKENILVNILGVAKDDIAEFVEKINEYADDIANSVAP